ncbi:MAG: hypothetical protein ACI8PZ_004881 [Myxococcota bacterium]|jgi:hypothetical protein
MRWCGLGVVVLALAGCGGKYKPKSPVLTGWERTRAFPAEADSTARYTAVDDAKVKAPVLPLMAFGMSFDVAVSLRSRHNNWDMHEFGRIATPDGPVWVALETREGSYDQYLTADVADIDLFMPEVPFQRKGTTFEKTDSSGEEAVDVALSYENIDGEMVELTFKGDPPFRYTKKRNVDVLGQSNTAAIVAKDLQHRESAFKASLKIGGKGQGLEKVGLFVPFQWATEQSQGGLAVANFNIREGDAVRARGATQKLIDPRGAPEPAPAAPEAEPEPGTSAVDEFSLDDVDEDDLDIEGAEPAVDERKTRGEDEPADATEVAADEDPASLDEVEVNDRMTRVDLPVPMDVAPMEVVSMGPELVNFSTLHLMPSGMQVEQLWDVTMGNGRAFATQSSGLRTMTYEYVVDQDWGALELQNITVEQFGRGVPTTSLQFAPALPDLRKPFSGRHTSRYVIDVNGQANSAVGTVECWWTETGPRVKVTPESPDWTKGRGMLTKISYATPGEAAVRIERVAD